MSDKSAIEWTDATWRPGQHDRRVMARMGLRWCRECRWWLSEGQVTKNGLCQPHENEDYRRRYAAAPDAICQRTRARKRGVAPLPVVAIVYLLEQFDGLCAYCCEPASTWDHIVPISEGGTTEPGNIVPACASCNSSKKATPLEVWLPTRSSMPHVALSEVIALEAVA